MFKAIMKRVVFVVLILIIMLQVLLIVNIDTVIHNYKMRYDSTYRMEYMLKGMCYQYGWNYVED